MQNFLEMQCSVDDLVDSLELLIFIIYQYYLMKWIGDPDTKKKNSYIPFIWYKYIAFS